MKTLIKQKRKLYLFKVTTKLIKAVTSISAQCGDADHPEKRKTLISKSGNYILLKNIQNTLKRLIEY